jgi:hypothetical protein
MKKAIRLVEQGGKSGRSAAEKCRVPPSSLWMRVQQRKREREEKEKVDSCERKSERRRQNKM